MDNSALVPADSSQSQFTQQGSVDWITLAQTTISFPMSVLARLAAADIAPHTVVVGQRISSIFVLSTRGTERLTDALNRLPSCSSIGNAIWFGFGIKHIVREIAQTAPGVTLLTLCGTLAELHPPMGCASIMMKLAEVCGAPAEQRPSPQQWINMVEASSGILRPTTFGCIAGQFMAFSPRLDEKAGDAEGVARALHALALLSSNDLESITLVGDQACGWIAAFGYFFLGLDVEIRTQDGTLCYRSVADDGHVRVFVVYDGAESSPRAGNQVQVSRKAYRIETIDGLLGLGNFDFFAMSGSVPWKKCITEVFGTPAVRLLEEAREEFGNLIGCAARIFQGLTQAEPSRYFQRGDFQTWFGFQTGQSGLGFAESALSWFPELAVLRDHIRLDQGDSVDDAVEAYAETASKIAALCSCDRCQRGVLKFFGHGPYCLALLAETIVFLAWNLSGMKLDADLKPYRTGLRCMYELHAGEAGIDEKSGTRYKCNGPFPADTLRTTDLVRHLDLASVYHTAQFLFTTNTYPQSTFSAFTAATVGGICFYFGFLREVSDAPERAAILHVTPGSIATREGRKYAHVIDKTGPDPAGVLGLDWRERNQDKFSSLPVFQLNYTCQPPRMSHTVGPELSEDTGSNDLEASLVVEESPRALLADLCLSGSRGSCRVGVYQMLKEVIGSSGLAHCSHRSCAAFERLPVDILIVDGEGRMPKREHSLRRTVYVRRLTGNPLARCVGLLVGKTSRREQVILRRRECIPCCTRAAVSGYPGLAYLIL